MVKRAAVESTAEAYLELLAARGIEYLFANAGTDFAPLIEAYAKRGAQGQTSPRPLTIPHETPAVAMAHGYTMVSGRPQAVMVREYVKWDYELRGFSQLETVVDRALTLAQAEPQGPVYLTLPREVLSERHETFEYADPARAVTPGPVVPAPEVVAEAAQLLAAAGNPLIIVKAAGRDPRAVPALVALAEALGAPVFEQANTYINFPQDHALHAGFDPAPHLEEADVILVVESDVPWFPNLRRPRPETKIIHLGVDPLFSRYPIRGFPADLALAGTPRLALAALAEAVAQRVDASSRAKRRTRWEAEHTRVQQAAAARAKAVQSDTPIDMAWVSRCVGDLVDDKTIVVNEYDLDPTQCRFTRPGSFFGAPPSGGLGWGLGAALGAKLAAPDHTVICCVGDGSYIFGAPTAAHWVSRAYNLPVLWVVFNNRTWNAVKRAVQSHARDGWAVKTDSMPLTGREPAPDYEMVCRASGGHGERVEDPAQLPDALARGLRIVKEEKRQVLLNVICRKPR